jgi:IPT/TIG domain-containing protein
VVFASLQRGALLASDLTLNTTRTFASLDGSAQDDDGLANGVLTINGNLTLDPGGCITCNDTSGGSACPIKIEVGGDMEMKEGSCILAENLAGGGNGGNIDIHVGGSFTMRGPNGAIPGAVISSSKKSGAGDTGVGGDISINVDENVDVEEGAKVTASAVGPAGDIEITGRIISIDGQVLSEGVTTAGQGGQIFVVADCDLSISDAGKLSSMGKDPGADLVHVEGGCSVLIDGLVQSTGPGHIVNAVNHCKKPGKPVGSSACVEVWSGEGVIIDATSSHNGQVNADTAQSGGTQGTGWIDIFAKSDIVINGVPAAPPNTKPYAVHANQTSLTNSHGGIVTVASVEGGVTTSGKAIQANGTPGGSRGGSIDVEAGGAGTPGGDVAFNDASIQARGATSGGGGQAGGSIFARSFNGHVTGNAPGELNAGGDAAAKPGSVTLQGCDVPAPAVSYTGAVVPTPAVILAAACGGAPTLPAFVTLPVCACVTQCFCLTSFTPANGTAGATVTIRGSGLLLVAEVRFDTDCNPATGTVAPIVTKSDTKITVTLPALAPGTYHIVATGASGSFCTATTFAVP